MARFFGSTMWSDHESPSEETIGDVEISNQENFGRDSYSFPDQSLDSEKQRANSSAFQAANRAEPVQGFSLEAKADEDPPVTSLEFQISKKLFNAARKSAESAPTSFWSYTMYEKATQDGVLEKVKVHYCTSKHSMEHVCKKYFAGENILGFDLEWEPFSTAEAGPRANVSLIQLASESRIGLFHVAQFIKDDFVAPTFEAIMMDQKTSKVGVSILSDCTRLERYLGVKSRGVFELSHLHKLVTHARNGKSRSLNKVPVALAKQVQEHLLLPLSKANTVRTSRWSRRLDARQIQYAATDAYAGLQIYHVLEAKRLALDPSPQRPHFAELRLPIPIPDWLEVLEDKDVRVLAAEESVSSYREAKGAALTCRPAAIRTFYIWQDNVDLTAEAIGELLRDPPFKATTVMQHILDAIIKEELPYDKGRLKKLALLSGNANIVTNKQYENLFHS